MTEFRTYITIYLFLSVELDEYLSRKGYDDRQQSKTLKKFLSKGKSTVKSKCHKNAGNKLVVKQAHMQMIGRLEGVICALVLF